MFVSTSIDMHNTSSLSFSVPYNSFFDYYRDWQKFVESHPDQVLVIYYEDMHKVSTIITCTKAFKFMICDLLNGFVRKKSYVK